MLRRVYLFNIHAYAQLNTADMYMYIYVCANYVVSVMYKYILCGMFGLCGHIDFNGSVSSEIITAETLVIISILFPNSTSVVY